MIEESINFLSDGFKLEGVLSYSDDESNESVEENSQNQLNMADISPQVVLLCSPHPNLGGDMENNVILDIAETLAKSGFITLRFNYRGVGESESGLQDIAQKFEYWEKTMDTEHYGDFVTDVNSAQEFLRKTVKNSFPEKFPFVSFSSIGYSFGGVLCMRLLSTDSTIKSGICISLPFGKYDLSFVRSLTKPKYFICSDGDFASTLDEARQSFKYFADPKRMDVLVNCDHFYREVENVVSKKIVDYLNNSPKDNNQ